MQVQCVQKNKACPAAGQGFLKDKIMDDKMMKNYFIVYPFVFLGCDLSALGMIR